MIDIDIGLCPSCYGNGSADFRNDSREGGVSFALRVAVEAEIGSELALDHYEVCSLSAIISSPALKEIPLVFWFDMCIFIHS
jgi:hypothetical protein